MHSVYHLRCATLWDAYRCLVLLLCCVRSARRGSCPGLLLDYARFVVCGLPGCHCLLLAAILLRSSGPLLHLACVAFWQHDVPLGVAGLSASKAAPVMLAFYTFVPLALHRRTKWDIYPI